MSHHECKCVTRDETTITFVDLRLSAGNVREAEVSPDLKQILRKSSTVMDKSVKGVKHNDVYITPSHIEFVEAFEGISYQQCIIIKNVGNRSAFIRIRQPNSIVNITY